MKQKPVQQESPQKNGTQDSAATKDAHQTEEHGNERFWSGTVNAVKTARGELPSKELSLHRKKAQINFSYNLRLVLLGILIFVLLNHLDVVTAGIGLVLNLVTPLLLGGDSALIHTAPRRAIAGFVGLLNRKLKHTR